MTPQHVRFLVEEVLENRIGFYPTYATRSWGLAGSVPLTPADKFSITYYAPQPRAVLRVVNPTMAYRLVEYSKGPRLTTRKRRVAGSIVGDGELVCGVRGTLRPGP